LNVSSRLVYDTRVGEDRSATRRRVTVPDAARLLGISVEAVRGRIKRDILEHEKAPDGTVYVLLDADQPRPVGDQPTNQSTDQALLIARLENEVQFLREELARKDAVMLSMTEAIKAISPPAQEEPVQERPRAPTAATPQPGRVEPQVPLDAAQEPIQERPESSTAAADEQQGRGPVPDATGPREEPTERPWWRFWG
jgi:hypothetical protein